MAPPDLKPEKLIEELADYCRKLQTGAERLCATEERGMGASPREAIYREDNLTLYRYLPANGAPSNPVPLLIVYALVNRPYMADLQADRSMIRKLLEAGQAVYLIDWGYPDSVDRFLTLDDYVNGYIDRCVDQLRERHGAAQVNLLGICQGGAMSLCYTALHQAKIRNLVTMVTPVDFQTPDNMLSAWVQHLDVDLLVDVQGNIPGEFLNWTFMALKPFTLTGQKYLHLVDILEDDAQVETFLRMEQWIFDSPDQAGETFRQFIKQFYQQNGLIKGEVVLGGRNVKLEAITCPVLNIYGEQDHLVPPAASRALQGLTGSRDYTELAFPGGHIGIYVSGKAQALVPPAIGQWLDER
ncbi:class III poly(R)-hydroxyalkanoic acid synthase subunit PhaC [Sedimenticola thiotaurini]|uniref:Poly(3-hydroxyalkanoate) polymerase subunit PhaC n=1 Tax=Sedimenticola thiotaurini TaxID=1543721 RepID=A0A0F7K161_9GAMM|nr:class III poly(R)-hydroxyalkanoic acid synthase subunit PhaC [Sedimenticola thiotaurini]AKH20693.1 poly-beta-hydroxybutyrate polymerase [Sedimenticola thiotaurini]